MLEEKQGVLATASRGPRVERTFDEDVAGLFRTALQKTEGIRYGSPSFILKIPLPEGATCRDQPADTNLWLSEELSTSYTPATDICSLRLSNLETQF